MLEYLPWGVLPADKPFQCYRQLGWHPDPVIGSFELKLREWTLPGPFSDRSATRPLHYGAGAVGTSS
jgi:hypothetical protein